MPCNVSRAIRRSCERRHFRYCPKICVFYGARLSECVLHPVIFNQWQGGYQEGHKRRGEKTGGLKAKWELLQYRRAALSRRIGSDFLRSLNRPWERMARNCCASIADVLRSFSDSRDRCHCTLPHSFLLLLCPAKICIRSGVFAVHIYLCSLDACLIPCC